MIKALFVSFILTGIFFTSSLFAETRIYDKNYNLKGRIKDNKVYGKNYNLKGQIEKNEGYMEESGETRLGEAIYV